MKIVLVEWVDANAHSGWYHKEHIHEEHASNCATIGVLLKDNDKDIIVALNISGASYGDTMSIPKCSIKRLRTLRVR